MESTTVQDAAILGPLEMGSVNVRVHVCVQSHPFVKKRARRYTVIHRTGQEHFDPYLSLSEAILTGRWGLLTGITCVCVYNPIPLLRSGQDHHHPPYRVTMHTLLSESIVSFAPDTHKHSSLGSQTIRGEKHPNTSYKQTTQFLSLWWKK